MSAWRTNDSPDEVLAYLKDASVPVVAQDLGGTLARRICCFPGTGRVALRHLRREEDLLRVHEEEKQILNLCVDLPSLDLVDEDEIAARAHGALARHHRHGLRPHHLEAAGLAGRAATGDNDGMLISADQPTRSVRPIGERLVLLGGEGHKVGQDPDTRRRYGALEAFARERRR